MAISNGSNVRTLDGKAIEKEDIKVGLKVQAPSGLGGSFTYECVSLDADKATFSCCHKSYPRELVIKFDIPDFTDEEIHSLAEALRAYDSSMKSASQAQRALVIRASELGYAQVRSHTQAHWTQLGVDRYNNLSSGHSSSN